MSRRVVWLRLPENLPYLTDDQRVLMIGHDELREFFLRYEQNPQIRRRAERDQDYWVAITAAIICSRRVEAANDNEGPLEEKKEAA